MRNRPSRFTSRAISTASAVGNYDDLAIRYPLPYRSEFEQWAGNASISATWAYGIARSESLFMRDVRSSAGAIGLMQLMPATGKDVANQLRVPYSGAGTLVNPATNIRLGTAYLSQMINRFGGNISRTAGFVGMERSALHRKLKSLNVVTSSRSGSRFATVAEEVEENA